MKTTERNEIILQARKDAFLYFVTGAFYHHYRFGYRGSKRYDLRTLYGRNRSDEEKKWSNNSEMVEISRKAHELRCTRQRAKNQEPAPLNILHNKLYVDFKTHYCSAIYRDHLNFYGRNHWAKNRQDLNVLEVLRRHHPEMAK